jgi:molybdenum cofactor cytidylyltransferase
MGGPNKLLVAIDGKPMVRRAVEAALAARLAPVLVVTGHMRDQVAAALAGMPVRLVDNPDYAQGLASSLKAGLAALPEEVDAAVVLLGDMPKVTGRLIRALVEAYDPTAGRAVVVPTRHGKRGNPVLWDRRFFAAMRELAGDAGAKALIGQNEELLAEVEAGDDAPLTDIDTPEALAEVTGSAA